MNVNEITNEAPVGLAKQIGRKVGATALGAVGAKATAAGLSGAAETGDVARQLNVDLRKYAGQTGMNLKQLDVQDLVAFLKSKGFPTTSLASVSGVIAPKQIDQALLKAAQEKAKISGAKAGPGVAGSNAASGKPAASQQGGSFLDRAAQKVSAPASQGQQGASGATGAQGAAGASGAQGAKPQATATGAKPQATATGAKPQAKATGAGVDPNLAKQIEALKAKIQKLNTQQKQDLIGMI